MKTSCWQPEKKAWGSEKNIGIGHEDLERPLPMGITTLGGEGKTKDESLKRQVEKRELVQEFLS